MCSSTFDLPLQLAWAVLCYFVASSPTTFDSSFGVLVGGSSRRPGFFYPRAVPRNLEYGVLSRCMAASRLCVFVQRPASWKFRLEGIPKDNAWIHICKNSPHDHLRCYKFPFSASHFLSRHNSMLFMW